MVAKAAGYSRSTVKCVFCAASTELPPAGDGRAIFRDREGENWSSDLVLVRCRLCGREAPYLHSQIILT